MQEATAEGGEWFVQNEEENVAKVPPITVSQTVGSLLKAARLAKKITLWDVVSLAERKGVPFSCEGYRKAECGLLNPSETMLRRYATTLDIDPAVLIKASAEDYMEHRFGSVVVEPTVDSKLKALNPLWVELTPEQQKNVEILIVGMAAANKNATHSHKTPSRKAR